MAGATTRRGERSSARSSRASPPRRTNSSFVSRGCTAVCAGGTRRATDWRRLGRRRIGARLRRPALRAERALRAPRAIPTGSRGVGRALRGRGRERGRGARRARGVSVALSRTNGGGARRFQTPVRAGGARVCGETGRAGVGAGVSRVDSDGTSGGHPGANSRGGRQGGREASRARGGGDGAKRARPGGGDANAPREGSKLYARREEGEETKGGDERERRRRRGRGRGRGRGRARSKRPRGDVPGSSAAAETPAEPASNPAPEDTEKLPEDPTERAAKYKEYYPDRDARTAFVRNLPFKCTEDALAAFFDGRGGTVSARIVKDKSTGKSRGFAHVDSPRRAPSNSPSCATGRRSREEPSASRGPCLPGVGGPRSGRGRRGSLRLERRGARGARRFGLRGGDDAPRGEGGGDGGGGGGGWGKRGCGRAQVQRGFSRDDAFRVQEGGGPRVTRAKGSDISIRRPWRA